MGVFGAENILVEKMSRFIFFVVTITFVGAGLMVEVEKHHVKRQDTPFQK